MTGVRREHRTAKRRTEGNQHNMQFASLPSSRLGHPLFSQGREDESGSDLRGQRITWEALSLVTRATRYYVSGFRRRGTTKVPEDRVPGCL